MKKIVAVVLCIVMMMSICVSADAFSEQYGFVYERIDNSDVLEIVGIASDGELADAKTISIPYFIKGLTVVQIARSAFMNNSTVENINLTEKILEISNNAMYGMKALKSITFPKNLMILGKYSFAYCSALESVNFETKNLTQIKDFTFYSCTKLDNVILPTSLFEIGEYAFAQCTNLNKIYIPSSVNTIADNAFSFTNSELTIYGNKNSYAHRYALEHSINFVDMAEKSLDGLSQSIYNVSNIINYADSSWYTEETFDAFSAAYENAIAVKENFFSTPTDVETAKTELDNAYGLLRLKSMDNLDTLITQAEDKMSVSFKYTEASVSSLEEALHQAKNVQNSTPATETQVQNAIQNLSTSINALETITQTDT
ncbi:MAG: leucine-rich repeat protein, partial [Alphaproteobacteria bacterium]|nr:leucine-rich repeat protein [Alphaproteobacteria bacterium]